METSAPLVNAIIDNVLLHASSHISQMLPQSFISCARSGGLVAPDFVVNCFEVRTVQLPQIWTFLSDHDL